MNCGHTERNELNHIPRTAEWNGRHLDDGSQCWVFRCTCRDYRTILERAMNASNEALRVAMELSGLADAIACRNCGYFSSDIPSSIARDVALLWKFHGIRHHKAQRGMRRPRVACLWADFYRLKVLP